MAPEHCYGIIKYNKKEDTIIIIIDIKKTTIYDSRVGDIDLKALGLKGKLSSDEKNKVNAYMKPLMINSTDRNNINRDTYYESY